jgi:menaquinone-specific isochorismate synthase
VATGNPTADHAAARDASDAILAFGSRLSGHDGPAILTVPIPDTDPLLLWRVFPDLPATYWRSPLGYPVASVGSLRSVAVGPEVDPADAERTLDQLSAELIQLCASSEEARGDRFRLFGGTEFDAGQSRGAWSEFGSGEFVLPAWSLERGERGTVLQVGLDAPLSESDLAEVASRVAETVTRLAAEEQAAQAPLPIVRQGRESESSDRARRNWVAMVEAARAAMRMDLLEKVVLCRRCEISFDAAADPVSVLNRLSFRTGEYVFGIRRDGMTFLGASPELLMAKRGRELRSDALAGTCRIDRSNDRSAGLAAAAEQLFGSGKDLEEHALVVRGIVDALEPLSVRRVLPAWPAVRALKDLAHLCSEIEVELRDEVGPVAVLRALHPTPAVGGLPRDAALRFLSDTEPVERGWYAGPVGWISSAGDAEIAVGIRSALLAGPVAYLYAGAGIVRASDPDAEFLETEDKLGRLSAALGVDQIPE